MLVKARDLPSISSSYGGGLGMLSDEQRKWLNSAPYDGTTGNPVLARYASLYVGGPTTFYYTDYVRMCMPMCVCVCVVSVTNWRNKKLKGRRNPKEVEREEATLEVRSLVEYLPTTGSLNINK